MSQDYTCKMCGDSFKGHTNLDKQLCLKCLANSVHSKNVNKKEANKHITSSENIQSGFFKSEALGDFKLDKKVDGFVLTYGGFTRNFETFEEAKDFLLKKLDIDYNSIVAFWNSVSEDSFESVPAPVEFTKPLDTSDGLDTAENFGSNGVEPLVLGSNKELYDFDREQALIISEKLLNNEFISSMAKFKPEEIKFGAINPIYVGKWEKVGEVFVPEELRVLTRFKDKIQWFCIDKNEMSGSISNLFIFKILSEDYGTVTIHWTDKQDVLSFTLSCWRVFECRNLSGMTLKEFLQMYDDYDLMKDFIYKNIKLTEAEKALIEKNGLA